MSNMDHPPDKRTAEEKAAYEKKREKRTAVLQFPMEQDLKNNYNVVDCGGGGDCGIYAFVAATRAYCNSLPDGDKKKQEITQKLLEFGVGPEKDKSLIRNLELTHREIINFRKKLVEKARNNEPREVEELTAFLSSGYNDYLQYYNFEDYVEKMTEKGEYLRDQEFALLAVFFAIKIMVKMHGGSIGPIGPDIDTDAIIYLYNFTNNHFQAFIPKTVPGEYLIPASSTPPQVPNINTVDSSTMLNKIGAFISSMFTAILSFFKTIADVLSNLMSQAKPENVVIVYEKYEFKIDDELLKDNDPRISAAKPLVEQLQKYCLRQYALEDLPLEKKEPLKQLWIEIITSLQNKNFEDFFSKVESFICENFPTQGLEIEDPNYSEQQNTMLYQYDNNNYSLELVKSRVSRDIKMLCRLTL